jgi:hypothetical protein
MSSEAVVNEQRYRTVSDGDHEYVIPVERAADWYAFRDSEAFELGHTPEWAKRIDGRFTFTDPRCE